MRRHFGHDNHSGAAHVTAAQISIDRSVTMLNPLAIPAASRLAKRIRWPVGLVVMSQEVGASAGGGSSSSVAACSSAQAGGAVGHRSQAAGSSVSPVYG
jgi:hypothetical protein